MADVLLVGMFDANCRLRPLFESFLVLLKNTTLSSELLDQMRAQCAWKPHLWSALQDILSVLDRDPSTFLRSFWDKVRAVGCRSVKDVKRHGDHPFYFDDDSLNPEQAVLVSEAKKKAAESRAKMKQARLEEKNAEREIKSLLNPKPSKRQKKSRASLESATSNLDTRDPGDLLRELEEIKEKYAAAQRLLAESQQRSDVQHGDSGMHSFS